MTLCPIHDERDTSARCNCSAIVANLRALLRDLVDHDMGELPERDALCAADGPRQIERHEEAWRRAVAEVGPRSR